MRSKNQSKPRIKKESQSVDDLGQKPSGLVKKRKVTAKDLMKLIRDARKPRP